VPFRRDKLPIDVDTMISLSEQLVVLAGLPGLQSPEEARCAAQILGVSLALDPTNRQALELSKKMERGAALDPADHGAIDQAKGRAWHLMGWLEQKEAGADGNALAACLADILKRVDPEHPRAAEMAAKGEKGKWSGWVAAVDAFKEPDPAAAVVEPTPEPPLASSPSIAIKMASASVEIPLWYVDKVTKEVLLRPVSVNMKARIEGGDKKLRVQLPFRPEKGRGEGIDKRLQAFLEERHGEMPKGLQFSFELVGGIPYLEKRNGNVLMGAVLVLADSAFSGKPPEGIIFAEPDSDGSLKPPAKFWQTIRRLADREEGGRLILPSAAKEFMPPLITLDKAVFFFNFEVLMADDAASLCELASSPPENVTTAHEAFVAIREARGTRSLGSFLNHESTQQRLKQLIVLFPDHVSARMLALRGTSQWPKRLSRELFAREIRAALEPLASFFRVGYWRELKGEELEDKVDTSREQLAVVEKLFGSVSDRQELHAPALNVTKILGGLADDAKRSSELDGSRREHELAYSEAWIEYIKVVEFLTQEAGDADEYPIPDTKPTR
jgi:hypothetical protein